MYTEFYGFRMKPFQLTPDPEFLYLSAAHKKALAYLTYGIEDRSGFVAITGEIGAGKTTLIRVLMKGLRNDMVVARINNTLATSQQFLEMVLREFELDYEKKSKTQLLDTLNDFLVAQYAKKKHAILIIDEAQNLSIPLLEEVRMLSNLETDKSKLLQIIFVGQPKLREKLNRPELEQLRQRITVSYHLPPLDRDEVEGYINHRLNLVGPAGAVSFSPEAIDGIYAFSKGIPRLVNVVCDGALLAGYVAESRIINADMVKEVVTDLGQPDYNTPQPDTADIAESAETADVKELKNRLSDLTSRLDALDQRNRATEKPVAGIAPEELRASREEIRKEQERLEKLGQQLDNEKHRLDALAKEQEKRGAVLRDREVAVQKKESSLEEKERSLEQERVRVFTLAEDVLRREESLAAQAAETEQSLPPVASPAPHIPLEIFILECDEKVRAASADSMTARGLSVKVFATGEELVAALRREKGSGSYHLVVLDAMGSGVVVHGRMDFRGVIRTLNEEFPAVRKMITTAYPYYSLRREAMMTGVDYVIAKPDAREMNAGLYDLMFQQYIDEMSFCARQVYDQSMLFLEESIHFRAERLNG